MSEIAKYYYEAHVTIAPVFDKELDSLNELSKFYGFKVAKLLMQKRKTDTHELSKYDTFMTSHGMILNHVVYKTEELIKELKSKNYKVLRYKIEDIVLDSKIKDELNLLGDNNV